MNKIALIVTLIASSLLTTGCAYSSPPEKASFSVAPGLSGTIYRRDELFFERCFIKVVEVSTRKTVHSSSWTSCDLFHVLTEAKTGSKVEVKRTPNKMV